jgi:glutamate racemase
MDVMVLACTHFPLLADEISAAFPHIAQVDGGAGIARRIAFLTRGQPWPVETPGGVAVFTAPPRRALASSLAAFGLTEIKML